MGTGLLIIDFQTAFLAALADGCATVVSSTEFAPTP